MHPYVHCSTIYNCQDMKATQVPIHRQVDKKVMVRIYNGILLSYKQESSLTFATAWMGLDGIMLSEVSQPDKDKCHMISFICGI